MRGENMPKLAYVVVKSPQFYCLYKKSWSLNTIVRAVFTPEAELTPFLRMRTKEIVKTAKMFADRRDSPVTGNRGRRSERRGQKLVSRRFCACAVKIGQKLAYFVVKLPKFYPFYGQSQSMNTTLFKPDKNLILSADCNKTANINVKT